jgi:hypothetical protein
MRAMSPRLLRRMYLLLVVALVLRSGAAAAQRPDTIVVRGFAAEACDGSARPAPARARAAAGAHPRAAARSAPCAAELAARPPRLRTVARTRRSAAPLAPRRRLYLEHRALLL